MNDFEKDLPDTAERTLSEDRIERLRCQGGLFVEAVRLTRMPMIITDATLPGNPIMFANGAFTHLSGYSLEELLGQNPHFMNGPGTDANAIRQYELSMNEGRDENLEILQYRKDGTDFQAMLFASPVSDGKGKVTNHFLSYLDISRRYTAETELRIMAQNLEERVQQRTAELQAANENLNKVVSERETLLVEVNHRAKNSLAVASSLLQIQGRRQPDKAVKILFEEAQDRLNAMARVHDMLSESEVSQCVDIAVYVSNLCEALKSLTGIDDRITLRTMTEENIMVDANTAFPLGIILTELITNSVKYAFPPPREGMICAKVFRDHNRKITISLKDDGIGMAHLRENSLGYTLITSLVEQINATMEIVSDKGLEVTITLK